MTRSTRLKKKPFHRVIFPRRARLVPRPRSSETSQLEIQSSALPTDDLDQLRISTGNDAATSTMFSGYLIPDLFTSRQHLNDSLDTETSEKQDAVVQECLPFLSALTPGLRYNKYGIPSLDRKRHIAFLHRNLRRLPATYTSADASRPWIFYWALNGLATMGEDVSEYRTSLTETVRSIQNPTGGFGGGNGQMSHLAPSYAVVLALALVGGHESFDVIDRKAMWKWLGSLKQPDGGFQMAVGGEVDVRGAYCAVVIISLLNLPIELPRESPLWSREENRTLLTGLPEWITRCQSFEGGISSRPHAEAHGAFTFCALACLCILEEPSKSIPRHLNVSRLMAWLSARQHAPEGGFSGRCNKLVDGCYSHWIGGCWPLIEASLIALSAPNLDPNAEKSDDLMTSVSSGHLYSREGLIRYILCCCQDQTERGGLRDKPCQMSDSYHTCYVLAGLASAQTNWRFNDKAKAEDIAGLLSAPFSWSSDPDIVEDQIYDEADRVKPLHPIFVIPEEAVVQIHTHFLNKQNF